MEKHTEKKQTLRQLLCEVDRLRKVNSGDPGISALADMLIETYEEKYGKLTGCPTQEVEHIMTSVHYLLENNRKVFIDQELLDIAASLYALLGKKLLIKETT